MISAITNAWSAVMEWIVEALADVQTVFYTAPTTTGGTGELTFLGILAVIGVAIGIAFLIIGVVQNFLKLRG